MVGVKWSNEDWVLLFSVTLTMTILILIAFYYEEIKLKKEMTIYSLISVFIYISILFAFVCFITVFNISTILINSIKNNIDNQQSNLYNNYYISIRMFTYIFQTVLCIVNLTYFKDLFFVIASILIEIGIFIEESDRLVIIICIISLISSSILTVYKYGKKVIGIEDERQFE